LVFLPNLNDEYPLNLLIPILIIFLYLSIKNIKLGPTLPAFLSPNVANVLVETFGINGIGTVQEDIVQFLG